MAMPRFIVLDSSINRYGYRVKAANMSVENFLKNPVMFYRHDRWEGVIGRWRDLQYEQAMDRWTAVPEFDEKDEMGAKIARQVEEGFLNAVSVGLDVDYDSIEYEINPLIPGQEIPVVSKYDLLEISIADIPALSNATRLACMKKNITLSAGSMTADTLSSILTQQKPEHTMKTVLLQLGLSATANEAEALQKVTELTTKVSDLNTKLTGSNTTIQQLEQKITDLTDSVTKDKAKALVEGALSAGKITKPEEAHYLSLAELNYEAVKSLLDQKKGYNPISNQLTQGQNIQVGQERNVWTLTDWQKKDPEGLGQLRQDNPEAYKALLSKVGKK